MFFKLFLKIKLAIKYKIIIPTAILIILGMGISTVISYINGKKAIEKAIEDQITKSVSMVTESIHSWVKDRELDMKSWSEQTIFRNATKDSFTGNVARKASNNYLAALKESYDYYDGIYLANTTGDVIAATDPEVVNKFNLSKNSYFQKALKGEFSIQDPKINEITKRPVIIICAPIKENNQTTGLIIGAIDLSKFNRKFLDRIKVGEKGYAYAVNMNGLLVAHPDKSKILKENLLQYDFGREILEVKKGLIKYTYEGVEKIVAFHDLDLMNMIIAIGANTEESFAPTRNLAYLNLLTASLVTLVALICMFIVGTAISVPIRKTAHMLKDIAEGEGDLTRRLEVKMADETGDVAKWFNIFIEKIQGIVKEVAANTQALDSSSNNLSDLAAKMSSSTQEMANKSNEVSSASGQMSENMNSVASAMEEASTNMNTISVSAEQMTATINEIAQNSQKANSISDNAVLEAKSASDRVDELGRAAKAISKVTETITKISEQTNLLALNATIEAARAGEAGKGFVVVATEIKELARQTAEATSEIKKEIDGIQNSTDSTVTQIGKISRVIHEVSEIVSLIATAIEEQSTTTKEIAQNVVHASQGIEAVNKNVAQSNQVTQEITNDLSEANQAIAQVAGHSSQVNTQADELKKLSEQLKEMVIRFKI